MASLYRRGNVWWGKWYRDGKMVRQSLGTQDKAEARRRLREREAQRVNGVFQTTSTATWDTAAADLMTYYRSFGTRNPTEAAYKLKTLGHYFTGMKLTEIDAAAILGYVAHRRAKGIAPGSINVELATLRRALRLAQEYGKLEKVPAVRMLRPAPPRSGFFERDQFEAIAQVLPPDLSLVTRIAYTYGWRINSEVLTLTRGQVDLDLGTLRLQPGTTKNRDGRIWPHSVPDARAEARHH